MNPTSRTSDVTSAGKQIVTWLTVLQVVQVAAAVMLLVVSLTARGGTGGLSRTADLTAALVQLAFSVAYVLAVQAMKGWLSSTRAWATGEGAPEGTYDRTARTLGRWLTLGQWLPLVALLLLAPLVWLATSAGLDPATLRTQLGEQGRTLTDEQLVAVLRASLLISLLFFGLPVIVINWAVLGWVRRWVRGVTDAVLGRPSRETRLNEVTATLGRWFSFFQGLQVFLIGLILLVPLLGLPQGQAPDRLTLLVWFLSLALQVALLRWTKTFMAGVLARVQGTRLPGVA